MGRTARRRVLSVVLLSASVAWGAAAALADPPRVAEVAGPKVALAETPFDQLLQRQDTLVQRLSPEMQKRLDAAGRDVFARLSQPAPPGARPKAVLDAARDVASDSFSILGSLTNGDAGELALLVMMQAAKSAADDLKAAMAGVKSASSAGAGERDLRSRVAALRVRRTPDGGLDSLGEVSAEQMMKMKTSLDRMTQAETALSTLLKRASDTQSAIVSNLK